MAHTWYWGPSHSGKSAQAFAGYNRTSTYVYDGGDWTGLLPTHTHIIIDDMTPALLDHRTLCRLTDKYPFFVRCSGRREEMTPRTITVTSLAHPEAVFEGTDDFCEGSVKQLLNRFTVVRCGDAEEDDSMPDDTDTDPEWLVDDD